MNNNSALSLVILAGGESRRMGRDKADLQYDGKTFLQMQIDKGKELGICDILVSGYRGPACPVRVVADLLPGKGPLGGLESCFRQAVGQRCLVLGVDVPLVPAEELRKLAGHAQKSTAKAVILEHAGKQEPLIGVYHTELAEQMRWEITHGKGSVFAFLRRIGYETYISRAPEMYFSNINDPETYHSVMGRNRS